MIFDIFCFVIALIKCAACEWYNILRLKNLPQVRITPKWNSPICTIETLFIDDESFCWKWNFAELLLFKLLSMNLIQWLETTVSYFFLIFVFFLHSQGEVQFSQTKSIHHNLPDTSQSHAIRSDSKTTIDTKTDHLVAANPFCFCFVTIDRFSFSSLLVRLCVHFIFCIVQTKQNNHFNLYRNET